MQFFVCLLVFCFVLFFVVVVVFGGSGGRREGVSFCLSETAKLCLFHRVIDDLLAALRLRSFLGLYEGFVANNVCSRVSKYSLYSS